jgi:hypothetical protein
MKHWILLLIAALAGSLLSYSDAQGVRLQQQGNATQLLADGKPFLIIGGELGNSSASCEADITRFFPKLRRMGLNTVLVPTYWELLEPTEGHFDFSLTDKVLEQARKDSLHVVFLWFGAWKNSMSCYVPQWVKTDQKRFPRAETNTGKPLEILSVFSPEVEEADEHAFTAWLRHLADADGEQHTVIMIQVENEIGMLEEARDYAPAAKQAYQSEVPSALLTYINRYKDALQPQLRSLWQENGSRTKGRWAEVFGTSLQADEVFMAWHYAGYVEKLAKVARRVFNVPLYVNAAMNSRGRKPGEYPSAGPLAHLMDVWHCAAPSIDILAPDLYDKGYTDWVKQYHQAGNPLFIPEIALHDDDGVRAFYAFGEHDALGFSPFEIERGSDNEDAPLVAGYACLNKLTPLLTQYQGTGQMRGVLFSQADSTAIIDGKDVVLNVRHYFTLPWDPRARNGSVWPEGGGLIIRLQKDEYLVAGKGLVVEFLHPEEYRWMQNVQAEEKQRGEDGFAIGGQETDSQTQAGQAEGRNATAKESKWNAHRIGLAAVEEVSVKADGTLTPLRRLNGDQTHQGRHVRIGVDDFQILHVKLYTY